VSGMFSRKARVKHTIKRMLFKLAILATVGLVALALAFYLIDEENLKSIQGVGLATV
jgi:F0F1-type ATP synthase membrane subunit c/vacuolar-type H+-ATPase subunit K